MSFELRQNAITETQMCFVSRVPSEKDYFNALSWNPCGAEWMPGHIEAVFLISFSFYTVENRCYLFEFITYNKQIQ